MDIDPQALGAAITAHMEATLTFEAAVAAVPAAEAAHDAAVRARRAGGVVDTTETYEAYVEANRILIVVTRRCAAADQDAIFDLRRQVRDARDPAERARIQAAHDAAVLTYDRRYLTR